MQFLIYLKKKIQEERGEGMFFFSRHPSPSPLFSFFAARHKYKYNESANGREYWTGSPRLVTFINQLHSFGFALLTKFEVINIPSSFFSRDQPMFVSLTIFNSLTCP